MFSVDCIKSTKTTFATCVAKEAEFHYRDEKLQPIKKHLGGYTKQLNDKTFGQYLVEMFSGEHNTCTQGVNSILSALFVYLFIIIFVLWNFNLSLLRFLARRCVELNGSQAGVDLLLVIDLRHS